MAEAQGKSSSSDVVPAGLENAILEEWSENQSHYSHKEPQPSSCPECGSIHFSKNGHRYLKNEINIQRYSCKKCGYRFSSQPPNDYKENLTKDTRQICATLQDAKNLTDVQETKTCAGDKTQKPKAEGQILQYLVYLKNQGRRDTTIQQKDWCLHRLLNLGADLNDPESVKKAVASLEKTESYKLLLCIAYEGFALKNGITWTRPAYKQLDRLPFVPHESEIDALIAGCGPKLATLLRLIKETAMRLGEAWQVEWIDFDPENKTIVCNHPEKNSRPRAFKISVELTKMLQSRPHNSQYIFTTSRQPIGKEDPKIHLARIIRPKGHIGYQRHRIAEKLKNPRIAQIHFHSLRHWKATKLKHQGFDLFDIAAFLGHRAIKNTVIYVHLEKNCYPDGGDDYIAKAALAQPEKLALIEAGFEHVSTDPDGTQYFRKRK